MGYTGGKAANPTYESVCDGDGHTEALKVEFDPEVVSFEELMRMVLKDACKGGGVQYQSAVWAEDDEQKAIARKVAKELKKEDIPIFSTKDTKWTDAEGYHQKYMAKMRY